MAETLFDIRPLTPQLWRDARPFDGSADESVARSLPLPLPSTLAGFMRTQVARNIETPLHSLSHSTLQNLHGIAVRGPVLYHQNTALLPIPKDALYMQAESAGHTLHRLERTTLEVGSGTDLEGILPMMPTGTLEGKPKHPYAYWTEQAMTQWLLGQTPTEQGCQHLPTETRIHIAIDGTTGIAQEGKLFGVQYKDLSVYQDHQLTTYTLRARVSLPNQYQVANIGALGGENKPVAVNAIPLTVPEPAGNGYTSHWYDCPQSIKEAFTTLKVGDHVRLVLATPALFGQGWKPNWLHNMAESRIRGFSKVKLELVAACVDRKQAVSGWELRTNTPKATRYAVPAGSVYVFKITEGDPTALLESWMHAVSDVEQDRKDGFGLALWGLA